MSLVMSKLKAISNILYKQNVSIEEKLVKKYHLGLSEIVFDNLKLIFSQRFSFLCRDVLQIVESRNISS